MTTQWLPTHVLFATCTIHILQWITGLWFLLKNIIHLLCICFTNIKCHLKPSLINFCLCSCSVYSLFSYLAEILVWSSAVPSTSCCFITHYFIFYSHEFDSFKGQTPEQYTEFINLSLIFITSFPAAVHYKIPLPINQGRS